MLCAPFNGIGVRRGSICWGLERHLRASLSDSPLDSEVSGEDEHFLRIKSLLVLALAGLKPPAKRELLEPSKSKP